VTAAAERLIDSHIERRALAPFLVSGTVQGQSVVKAVRSPAEALDEVSRRARGILDTVRRGAP
jgi:hypothetical protein